VRRLRFAAVTVAAVSVHAWAAPSATRPWSGKVECHVEINDGLVQRSETQTWTLTGDAPTMQGIMAIYPATWVATGSGSGARGSWNIEMPAQPGSLTVFVRASDQRLIFKQTGPLVEVRDGLKVAGATAMPVSEWIFGWIEADPRDMTVNGSRSASATAMPAGLGRAGAAAPTQCTWNFTREQAPLPAADRRSVVERPGMREVVRTPRSAPPPAAPTPTPANRAMPTPADFTAHYLGNNAVQLSWSPVTGAGGYRIDGAGIGANGLVLPPNQQGAVIERVPNGPANWAIAAQDEQRQHDPNNAAKTQLIVRGLPPHAPRFLTRPGQGSMGATMSHYMSACPCPVGAPFDTVARALGVTDKQLDQWDYDAEYNQLWVDADEAKYQNLTEFHSERVARCFVSQTSYGHLVCYAKSSDHGLTLLARKPPYTWFMTFDGPAGEPILRGTNPHVSSNYRLSFTTAFDSEGPKAAPFVCMSCHGGAFNPQDSKVTGATLLPIDPARISARNDKFHLINKAILDSSPPPPVVRFLDGMYGGNARAFSTANPDFVPSGWRANADLYRNVVRPYCIACHLNTPQGFDFSTEGGFRNSKALILASVCGSHAMPHSEYQFKDFWTKDTGNLYLPGYLAAALGGGECH
jgi:hypothetical protein